MPTGVQYLLSIEARSALIEHLRTRFAIDWRGIHGIAHWSRVWTNGRMLGKLTENVDMQVVELFAWLHDSCRLNEFGDPEHGPRAASLAAELRGEFFELTDEQLAELARACEGHTRGGTEASPTVMTCWDSDRLDLGRVRIFPEAERLCTEAAKRPEIIAWAHGRSLDLRESRKQVPQGTIDHPVTH